MPEDYESMGSAAILHDVDQCRTHLKEQHGSSRESVEKKLAKELEVFKPLAEKALALRAETIKAGQAIKSKVDQGKPLTGDDLATINHGINQHLALRDELMKVAESHECWLDIPKKQMGKLGLTPETRLKGIMLSLSSALILYDNYLLAVSLFEGDSKLRRLLNERDPGYAVKSAALAKITLNYNSISNRKRVRNAMKYFEKETARQKKSIAASADSDYLYTLISQSPSYSMVRKVSPFRVIWRKVGFLSGITTDTIAGLEREGVSVFSMVFGNAVGLVETRKGKLYGRKDVLTEMSTSLRPGDILLEKTPFRLTDKLIPGYWGHAAVWIGTESDLKQLGIWNHPVVKRHHSSIKEGRLVTEALRSGVEMNSLEHFMNIDSVGIMRMAEQTPKERAAIVIKALRQIGKPYDFNFDVESKGRVYCSKLVYLSYSGVDWPTKKSMGRTTFTPDDVAVKAAAGKPLQLVTFYHDGKKVNDAPTRRMAELVGRELIKQQQAAHSGQASH
ncbi:MAG TPA: YiiX/YebB-like N1pC/P60 family cysteine hydrolase [Deltaproteobacteria bacterium]|nr:YiiX/YebB-like N1pC/P60 family cysteine hydrolase [Deltaproteobacteria bacterium]